MSDITPRLPIISAGTVALNPDGTSFRADNWQFDTRAPKGETHSLEVQPDGTLAGWPLADLHLVAHGAPCDAPGCPLD